MLTKLKNTLNGTVVREMQANERSFRSLGLAKLYDNRGFGKGKRKQELIHTANGNVKQ